MNTEERKRLRNCLIDQGFKRTNYNQDFGDGVYAEVWENGADKVLINWGPRGES